MMTAKYYFWNVGFLLIGILDSVHNDIYAKEPADKLSRLVPGLFESFRNFILPLRFCKE